MKFNVNQQDLQQALSYCQGVIEKRSTLPILSNVLLDVNNSQLILTATDLDLIFVHQIKDIEVIEEGKTTTVSSTIYDIVRKFPSGKKINLSLSTQKPPHNHSTIEGPATGIAEKRLVITVAPQKLICPQGKT